MTGTIALILVVGVILLKVGKWIVRRDDGF